MKRKAVVLTTVFAMAFFSVPAHAELLENEDAKGQIVSYETPNGSNENTGNVKTVFGPVTDEIREISVTSVNELVEKFVQVVNGRADRVSVMVPVGWESACLKGLFDEIERFPDLARVESSYYSNSGKVEISIYYNDAVKAMAYLEGKTGSGDSDVMLLLEEAQRVHAQLVKEGMSEYEQVKAFHDYLVNFNTYQETGERSHNAIGALIDGKAVCSGYAKAFDLLCYLSGIECIQVTGEGISEGTVEPHAWNKVKVDGNWYNVDVTWDDPVGPKPMLTYDYFLISDNSIAKDHRWYLYSHLPNAPEDF